MGDEQTFLAALAASPADDTARLVYADWLDEHDQPAKADYLRLTCELAATGPVVDRSSPALPRLIDLAVELCPEWMAAAGSRFGLVLENCPPDAKIETIKLVRQLFGLGLAAAKGVVDPRPCVLIARAPAYQLVQVDYRLCATRRIQVRLTRVEARFRREPFLFNAFVLCAPTQGEEYRRELIAAAAQVLGRSRDAVSEAILNNRLVVAEAVDARTVGRVQAALDAADPAARPLHFYVNVEPVSRTSTP